MGLFKYALILSDYINTGLFLFSFINLPLASCHFSKLAPSQSKMSRNRLVQENIQTQ